MLEALEAKKESLSVEEKPSYGDMEALEAKIKHVQVKIAVINEMIAEETEKIGETNHTEQVETSAYMEPHGFTL